MCVMKEKKLYIEKQQIDVKFQILLLTDGLL